MFLHAEVNVRLLVLHEVFDPLVERPRDVRRPIKAEGIEGRYALVGQFYPFSLALPGFLCAYLALMQNWVRDLSSGIDTLGGHASP